MQYINTLSSCLYTHCQKHFEAKDREVCELLFAGKYKISRFLPSFSIAAISSMIATSYIAIVIFQEDEGRHIAEYYKNMPDWSKNYISFKTAKVIAIVAAPAVSCAVFSTAMLVQSLNILTPIGLLAQAGGFAIQCFSLATLVPFAGLWASFSCLNKALGRNNRVASLGNRVDGLAINKLNSAINKCDETEAIKLVHQLYPGDIVGNFYNYSLLSRATKLGMKKLVKELIKGEYFNNKQINEALEEVHSNDNVDIMDCFVEEGRKIEVQSLFYKAVINKKINVIKWLCDKGANINAIDPIDGLTALHKAMVFKDEEVKEFLIKNNARQDIPSSKESRLGERIGGILKYRSLSKGSTYLDILKIRNDWFKEGIFEMASSGHINGVFYFAKKVGFSIDYQNQDYRGYTLFYYALHAAGSSSGSYEDSLNSFAWPMILKGADPTLLVSEGNNLFKQMFKNLGNKVKNVSGLQLEVTKFKAKCLKHYSDQYMLLKEVMTEQGIPLDLASQIYLPWINLANPKELL